MSYSWEISFTSTHTISHLHLNTALCSSSLTPLPHHGISLAATWERICEGERRFRVCAKKLLNGCGAWISEHKD